MSNGVSFPLTVNSEPIGFENEFRYALNLIGLPVPPGPGSCNSAVLKLNVMRVMLLLKLMSKGARSIVLGQRKSPEKFVEFMTVDIAAKELRFWTENSGFDGISNGELKDAMSPFDV